MAQTGDFFLQRITFFLLFTQAMMQLDVAPFGEQPANEKTAEERNANQQIDGHLDAVGRGIKADIDQMTIDDSQTS